jgi:hypothetical protein
MNAVERRAAIDERARRLRSGSAGGVAKIQEKAPVMQKR